MFHCFDLCCPVIVGNLYFSLRCFADFGALLPLCYAPSIFPSILINVFFFFSAQKSPDQCFDDVFSVMLCFTLFILENAGTFPVQMNLCQDEMKRKLTPGANRSDLVLFRVSSRVQALFFLFSCASVLKLLPFV